MKNSYLQAAAIVGSLGLGMSSASAQDQNACDISSQPDHEYTYRLVPHDQILDIHKRTVSTPDGYSTTEEVGKNGRTVRRPVKSGCADSASYVLHANKVDFDRLKEKGRIVTSTSVRFTPSSHPARACLDIPVKANRVVDDGRGQVSIYFTPDENRSMRAERTKYIYTFDRSERNRDVHCYSFEFGKVSMPASKPKSRPVIVKPAATALTETPSPAVKPPQPAPNFFQSLFGG